MFIDVKDKLCTKLMTLKQPRSWLLFTASLWLCTQLFTPTTVDDSTWSCLMNMLFNKRTIFVLYYCVF